VLEQFLAVVVVVAVVNPVLGFYILIYIESEGREECGGVMWWM
jgi:hypothetical protein